MRSETFFHIAGIIITCLIVLSVCYLMIHPEIL